MYDHVIIFGDELLFLSILALDDPRKQGRPAGEQDAREQRPPERRVGCKHSLAARLRDRSAACQQKHLTSDDCENF